jgi:hypothetical protein
MFGFLAANEAFRRVHRNGANRVLAKMLCDFKHKNAAVLAVDVQCVQNRRNFAVKLDVDNSARDLRDAANGIVRQGVSSSSKK